MKELTIEATPENVDKAIEFVDGMLEEYQRLQTLSSFFCFLNLRNLLYLISKGGSWQHAGGMLQPPWRSRRKADPPSPARKADVRPDGGFSFASEEGI